MKGNYILLIAVDHAIRIRIGRLGVMEFAPGCYAYVGSAMCGIESRVRRHLRGEKKLFWHIDYLLERARIVEIFQAESSVNMECRIAVMLSRRLETVPRFGCSDCKCTSHLLYDADQDRLRSAIEEVLAGADMEYITIPVDEYEIKQG